MEILHDSFTLKPEECPYLEQRTKLYCYSIHHHLTQTELNYLLSHGWRHFGYTFFKPVCPSCRMCIPVRIKTHDYKPAKNQRRTHRKNAHTSVTISELSLTRTIYTIYENHSYVRFNERPSLDFLLSNILDICSTTYQMEYYDGATLFAVDYVDETNEALSSIYCIHHSSHAALRPGIFSIMHSIEYAKQRGLPYLYLGYYVPGCSSMEYKISFHPYQWYSWEKKIWIDEPIML